MIHPSAVVHPLARLGEGVRIGPFCRIGEQVTIGDRCVLDSHIVIEGPTTIGSDNRFFPFCVIGVQPQDLKYSNEETFLTIGSHNTFREYVNVHRGTKGGGGHTRIGDHNFLMVAAHVAHDCILGNHIIMANAATLAGHVIIEDHATIGAYSGVHQFCRVGSLRIRRRVHGHYEGRPSVFEDGKRSQHAGLWCEHDRTGAKGIHARADRQYQGCIPTVAAVEPEHNAGGRGHSAERSRTGS